MSEQIISCGYCQQIGHRLSFCPQFESIKNAASQKSYVAQTIQPSEEQGFCAAGLVPYVNYEGDIKVLMIQETRRGQIKYNFMGGKRDYKVETPLQTAIREFYEETKLSSKDVVLNQQDIMKQVKGWNAKGKYILFRIPITDIATIQTLSQIKHCTWISLYYLTDSNLCHNHTLEMIDEFKLFESSNW